MLYCVFEFPESYTLNLIYNLPDSLPSFGVLAHALTRLHHKY